MLVPVPRAIVALQKLRCYTLNMDISKTGFAAMSDAAVISEVTRLAGNEQQATARYQAGLGTILEVADAQRLLTQAESDDAIARLNVWRGLLQVAASEGTLDPFLARLQP